MKKTGITCWVLMWRFPFCACEVIFKVLPTFSHILTAPVKAAIRGHLVLDPTTHSFSRRTAFCVAGMAGTVHFLSDILAPEASRFPAFELGSPQRDTKVQKDDWEIQLDQKPPGCLMPDTEPSVNPERGRKRRSRHPPRPPVSECDDRPSHQRSVTVSPHWCKIWIPRVQFSVVCACLLVFAVCRCRF